MKSRSLTEIKSSRSNVRQRTISLLVPSRRAKRWEIQLQYLQWHHCNVKLNKFFSLSWQHWVKGWITARQRCWVRLLAARKAWSNSTYPLQPSPEPKNDVTYKYAKHHAETTEAPARSLCRIASGQALCCSDISRSGSWKGSVDRNVCHIARAAVYLSTWVIRLYFQNTF